MVRAVISELRAEIEGLRTELVAGGEPESISDEIDDLYYRNVTGVELKNRLDAVRNQLEELVERDDDEQI